MAMAVRSSFVSCPLFPRSWFVGEGAHFIHFNSFTHYNNSVAPSSTHWTRRRRPSHVSAALDALIFDCDGVILESEDLHRQAYNATFSYFDVRCPSSASPVEWSTEFYDVLQNQIGGGKPKMRWYFNTNGWPSSSIFSAPPENELDKSKLIDTLQDWKTSKYKDIIQSGAVLPRPGVLRLMDEAKCQGVKVAVCSAATKSSVVFVLNNLIGKERFQQLDCFLAGFHHTCLPLCYGLRLWLCPIFHFLKHRARAMHVQGSGGRPDSSCCKVLKDVHTKSPICLCKLMSSQSDQASTLGVNLTLALQLPQACNMIVNPNKCPELERSRDPHLNPSTGAKSARMSSCYTSASYKGHIIWGSLEELVHTWL